MILSGFCPVAFLKETRRSLDKKYIILSWVPNTSWLIFAWKHQNNQEILGPNSMTHEIVNIRMCVHIGKTRILSTKDKEKKKQSNLGKDQRKQFVELFYLIMPPLTVPRTGSCHVLYRSCMSSCLWAWAQTNPAYLVTSGQSCEATTYNRTKIYYQHGFN